MRVQHLALLAALGSATAQSFENFEAPQTHPITVSADGLRLYAVNTPDARVAIFSLRDPDRPVLLDEISVGLEPVSVRARTAGELWVVDWLSDSIRIVSVERRAAIATLRVGDEPADVVFARGKAFVSCATDRVVRVFDAATRRSLGAIPILGDEPRRLLSSADESKVWVAVHRSGNQTTIVPAALAPVPPIYPKLPPPPRIGLIVSSEDPRWKSQLGVDLPDHDLIEIDVAAMAIRRRYSAVGTTLFGMARRPGTGEVWVANTDALNLVRFEPALRGHMIDSRVTRIGTGTNTVTPFDLNPTVDYRVLPNPPAIAIALCQPTDVAFDPAGKELFVAAFASDRVGVLDTTGRILARIDVGNARGAQVDTRNMRGPRALAHHPRAPRLYVLNRLSNSISVVDTAARRVLRELSMFDPTPAALSAGRGFLYDAKLSGNGTASCAVCHVDGDIDGLAWDLGDPGGKVVTVRSRTGSYAMHPVKGPMRTQTLRGIAGNAPFHWRGDRATLQDFNPAFASLLGKTVLPRADIDALAQFMNSIRYGPNPNRNLDDSLPTTPRGVSAKDGETFFQNTRFKGNHVCSNCHKLPTGSNGDIIDPAVSETPQAFKVPQLRNIYKLLGRRKTRQGRASGFGLTHDGKMDDVFDFLSASVFGPLSRNVKDKTKLEAFLLHFPTGTKPAVGYDLTFDAKTVKDARLLADAAVLMRRAGAGDCDLVAHGVMDGRRIGLLYHPRAAAFESDRAGVGPFTAAELNRRIGAGRGWLTWLATPPGSGRRVGIDRDEDRVRDGDEAGQPFGQASPGCRGGPALYANRDPRRDEPAFALVCANLEPGRAAVVLLGIRRTSTPVLGVTLHVGLRGASSYAMGIDARGLGVTELPIPDDPKLVGKSVFAQVVSTSACARAGLSASNGMALRIGAR